MLSAAISRARVKIEHTFDNIKFQIHKLSLFETSSQYPIVTTCNYCMCNLIQLWNGKNSVVLGENGYLLLRPFFITPQEQMLSAALSRAKVKIEHTFDSIEEEVIMS